MPSLAKPLPAPLDGVPFTGPAVYAPVPSLEALWPNSVPRYVEACGVLQGEAAGEPLFSVTTRVVSDLDDGVREALAASSSDPVAAALRQSLACCCRLGVALSTMPDSKKDADEDGVAGLIDEVEAARGALREARKAAPSAAALVAAERKLSAFALDFARATARAGLKGKGHGPKRTAAAAPPPPASPLAPQQTAEQIASEFSEDAAPAVPAPVAPKRARLFAGLGVLGVGVLVSAYLQLSPPAPATPPPPKVSFAPEGAISQVGEHTGVSMVDLGRSATAEQVAQFKAAAAAAGKTVREIAPGQFIFLNQPEAAGPRAAAEPAPADAGPGAPADATEAAP